MRVKELLLQALSRANHIEDGTPAEARELTKARRHFESAMSRYSSSNLITAFQRVCDIGSAEKQVVGKYDLKRGRIMHSVKTQEELPPVSRIIVGRDYAFIEDTKKYAEAAQDGSSGDKFWRVYNIENQHDALVQLGCCDFVPDVVVTDMERVMACMCRRKGEDGAFERMQFVPLVNYYADGGSSIYCSYPVGENKSEILLPKGMDEYDFRIVYYTKMEFRDDDYIDLPQAYKELLTLAVTVGLLSEDADSDPKQLANYSAQLTSMEDLVGANNVTTRRLTREPDGGVNDALRSGAFIRRRFGR